MTADIQQLHARIARLERDRANAARRLRVTLAAAAAVLCGLLVAARAATPEETETRRIVLKDDKGRVRYRVEVAADGGVVQAFVGADGAERIKTLIDAEGVARQRFYGDKGAVRVSLFAYPSAHKDFPDVSGLGVIDPADKAAVRIQADGRGGVTQRWTDRTGKLRIYAGVGADRLAGHGVLDDDGVERVTTFSAAADGKGFESMAGVVFRGPDGKARVNLLTLRDNSVHQNVLARDGTGRISLNVTADGTTRVAVDKGAVEQLLAAAGITPPVLDALRLLGDK